MNALYSCQHDVPSSEGDALTTHEGDASPSSESPASEGDARTESYHKISVLAETFGVTVPAIIQRIRLKSLPTSRVHRRWTFVSDTDLRSWFTSGIEFRNSCGLVINNSILLSCGHQVTGIKIGERDENGCRHRVSPTLHRVRIIARTYGVTEPAVFARIRTLHLPVSGADGKPSEARKGVQVFVSDEDLRAWIMAGVSFGSGAAYSRDSSEGSSLRAVTLACSWKVNDVPIVTPRRQPRLVRCQHGHPSGPVHSLSALARTLGVDVAKVHELVPSERRTLVGASYRTDGSLQSADGVYVSDEVARTTLKIASGKVIACGWVIE